MPDKPLLRCPQGQECRSIRLRQGKTQRPLAGSAPSVRADCELYTGGFQPFAKAECTALQPHRLVPSELSIAFRDQSLSVQ